jgi:uncharacterized damage-inducible protein DinB
MAKHGAVWLRGPLPDMPPLLQPVAHALLQVAEDLPVALTALPEPQIWAEPGRSAPIAFHLTHLTGSMDRLFTYARGEALNAKQLEELAAEKTLRETRPPLGQMLRRLEDTVQRALEQLRSATPDGLLEVREVGRAKIPSTTLGLFVHAAEHSARHAGQIATLIRVLT